MAAMWLDCQSPVGIDLATQDLAVLHAEAAGLATLGPLPYIPAKRERSGGEEIRTMT